MSLVGICTGTNDIETDEIHPHVENGCGLCYNDKKFACSINEKNQLHKKNLLAELQSLTPLPSDICRIIVNQLDLITPVMNRIAGNNFVISASIQDASGDVSKIVLIHWRTKICPLVEVKCISHFAITVEGRDAMSFKSGEPTHDNGTFIDLNHLFISNYPEMIPKTSTPHIIKPELISALIEKILSGPLEKILVAEGIVPTRYTT